MRTASKGEGSASWSSLGYTPRKMTSEDDNVFSFRETRVQEYLSSLSEASSSTSSSSSSSIRDSEDKVVDQFSGPKGSWVRNIIFLFYFYKDVKLNKFSMYRRSVSVIVFQSKWMTSRVQVRPVSSYCPSHFQLVRRSQNRLNCH